MVFLEETPLKTSPEASTPGKGRKKGPSGAKAEKYLTDKGSEKRQLVALPAVALETKHPEKRREK